jgi:hypothetical protein
MWWDAAVSPAAIRWVASSPIAIDSGVTPSIMRERGVKVCVASERRGKAGLAVMSLCGQAPVAFRHAARRAGPLSPVMTRVLEEAISAERV